jgi:serine/threonine-protein kinase RsbT
MTTNRGLGVGLPGAKWLMDEFEIQSRIGKNMVVTMKQRLT